MVLAPPPLERQLKILAIDTAGWCTSVALWEDGNVLSFEERHQEREQAALLPQMTEEVLAGHAFDQILVNVGPGSFTGIRVGIAFAKGLSLGLGLPLKGMDSFTATYLNLEASQDVLILLEARRQDVYGRYFQKGFFHPPASFTRTDIEQILALPTPPPLAGSGLHPFLEGLPFIERVPLFQGANALAYGFFKNPASLIEPLPFYVREADVSVSQVVHNS